MNNMENIGKFIAEKRKQSGMTQEAFANKLGISPQAVSKWENNVGLPDISLLPHIAKVLDISIDDMFKIKKPKQIAQFPSSFEGMDFICSIGNRACYSSKEVEKADENGKVSFKDGSFADITENYVENKGRGEVKIIEPDIPIEEDEEIKEKINEALPYFDSIEISLGIPCFSKIVKANDGVARIEAYGDSEFMKKFSFEVKNGRLIAGTKQIQNYSGNRINNNMLNIYTDFDYGKDLSVNINGCAECLTELDFETAKLNINGSGDIRGKNFKDLNARINGSGDIRGKSTEKLDATINGSGDIEVDTVTQQNTLRINGSGAINICAANNTDAQINGSGDIDIKKTTGTLKTKIAGSGDLKICGEVEEYFCEINGSGDIDAENLTTTRATVYLSGASEVVIGRIIESSKEKIEKTATLTVKQRG